MHRRGTRTRGRPRAVFVTAAAVAAGHQARFPRLDRNARARLMFRAEALDRRTRLPGQHGGVLKRTGLAVLKALLFGFHSAETGRCDPSYDTLARAAGVARSTVAVALRRLEAAGLLERVRRMLWVGSVGGGQRRRPVQISNAYTFAPPVGRGAAGAGESGNRAETTNSIKTNRTSGFEGGSGPTAESPAHLRAALRADYERIVRRRAARLAR